MISTIAVSKLEIQNSSIQDLIHFQFLFHSKTLNKAEIIITYQLPRITNSLLNQLPHIVRTKRILDEINVCSYLHKTVEEEIGHSRFYSIFRDHYRFEID
ncbi:hypothetical protein NEF87_002883 [Candidatus Lokiarchaeum ossiferum]|uniref:Uncharacterized protein n=1 Tax=Candidatus Lokiarchaeum ossiferum TaxID=2951803 RepID=A0ABY6HSV9_9ARCH|nr:hypothetical protein NEF87_002883 [Candidatus Lokiarchaeum sp. B-35]